MTTRAEKDGLYALPLDGVTWLAAEGSNPSDRFEIAHLPGGAVAVRQSGDPARGVLRYTAAEWSAYLDGAADGEFDPDLTPQTTVSRAAT
ncbi:DUF397 domain-containing protein [Streptomyces sp. PCS3-D2]|uniref:DUF397 domain-containing protein n=1 Tax=Streptomyces sp. PCS3-D2 TaxID=1460244 RepID=UPI0004453A07|nr:DUF397 domain-containing protein [Streptomyces sp. PCS3-D2]WKV74187.1 DUF397 domain-containing protein [Streptomyces sp. PCS3-D2]